MDGEEITEVYVAADINEKAENDKNSEYLGRMALDNQPKYCLVGFERNQLKKGETKRVSIVIDKEEMRTVLSDGTKVKETVYDMDKKPVIEVKASRIRADILSTPAEVSLIL